LLSSSIRTERLSPHKIKSITSQKDNIQFIFRENTFHILDLLLKWFGKKLIGFIKDGLQRRQGNRKEIFGENSGYEEEMEIEYKAGFSKRCYPS